MHKKILTILFFVLFAVPQSAWFWGAESCFAQVDTAWVRTYNGPGNGNDGARAIAVDRSGNVYVTGYSYGGTSYDDATIKYYPNGDTAWLRRYNGPVVSWYDEAFAIAVDDSGTVYVTGGNCWSGMYPDYATIKYYPNGGIAWVRRYNGPGNYDDVAQAIAVDGSGNVYVTGYCYDDSGTTSDYATIKYYPNGDAAWVRRYNGPENGDDGARAIAVDRSGNVYVTGFSLASSWPDYDYATIKYYPSGDPAWVRTYNGPGNSTDEAVAIAVDESGNVYVTGRSKGSGSEDDYATIKYDANGNQLWVRRYNGPGNYQDRAYAIAVDDSGNVYVTGYSYGNGTSADYGTIKYDQNGNQLWATRYNGPENPDDRAYDITVDGSNNVYVTGQSGGDYATIKYVQRGDLAVTGIDLIQVTQDAHEFIMNKKTVACVHVTSSFTEQTLADIQITYDFGQTYVERGPYGNGVPIQPGENRVYIPGGPVFHDSGSTDAWVGAGNPPWLNWTNAGIDDNIRAIVDPDSEVAESHESNNEVIISEYFVGSIDFRVLVVPVYFPDEGEQPYDLSMGDQQGFLLRTYPLAENRFTWNSIRARSFSGHPDVTDENHFFTWLYNNVVEPLVREARSRNYQRVVVVLPQSWESVLGGIIGYAIGMLRNPVVQSPVVVLNVNNEGLVAHEIGHTHWLWHPHDIGPPVYDAQRFWVENRDYEDMCNAFMSYRPPPLWVDSGRYDSDPKTWNATYGVWVWNLFDQFKSPAGKIAGKSQEVVVLGGIIYENGTVVGGEPWYLLPEGEPNISLSDTGDYFIVLCDNGHNELTRFGFNVSFDYWLYEGEDLVLVHTNSAVFSFNVPYVSGAKYIEVWDANNNVVLSKTVSAHSPTVGVIYPNGGEILTIGEEDTLVWEANDIDGDSLFYSVDYNVDGGNWVPIDWDLTEQQYTWNTSSLTPGENYRIRVMANDGVNIAVDSSDAPFSLTLGYLRGDANGDGLINSADVAYLINYLFVGGPAPQPWQAGDANCDGKVNSADVAYIINYLFVGGPAPGC